MESQITFISLIVFYFYFNIRIGTESLSRDDQKSISEEAALPQDIPSSAGNNIVSWDCLTDDLEDGGDVFDEDDDDGFADDLETPSWKEESVILLGV